MLYGIEARLKVRLHSVQGMARSIQNGVVCVEVDQGIARSKSNIIDIIYISHLADALIQSDLQIGAFTL